MPGTAVRPGMLMGRKLEADDATAANMRLRLPDSKNYNVASWLQATPDLAIQAAILRS